MATATNRSLPTRRAARGRTPEPARGPRTGTLLLYAAAAVFLLALVSLAVTPFGVTLAFLLTGGLLTLVILGPERMGIAMLALAYLLSTWGGTVGIGSLYAVDMLIVGAPFLLLPRLLLGDSRYAAGVIVGPVLILATGLVSSTLIAETPAASLRQLAEVVFTMLAIPVLIASLHPSRRLIRALAWSFVVGHLISATWSMLRTPSLGIRHMGLSHHPNAFAECGLLSLALLLYLLPRSRRPGLVYAAMAVSAASIYLSGSRGALVAGTLLLLAVPVVERNTTTSAVVMAGGAIALVVVSLVADSLGPASALGRLLGRTGGATTSDDQRTDALADGVREFLEHPFTGSGLEGLSLIHNLPLELLVGCGVLGLLGWLMLMWTLARPLFGTSPERALAYPVIAYAAFSMTAPALGNRTAWLVLALGVAVFRGYRDPVVPDDDPPAEDTERQPTSIPSMPGRTR